MFRLARGRKGFIVVGRDHTTQDPILPRNPRNPKTVNTKPLNPLNLCLECGGGGYFREKRASEPLPGASGLIKLQAYGYTIVSIIIKSPIRNSGTSTRYITIWSTISRGSRSRVLNFAVSLDWAPYRRISKE